MATTGGAIGQALAAKHPKRLISLTIYASRTKCDPYFRRVFEARRALLNQKRKFKRRSFDPAAGQVDVYPQEITPALLNLISNGLTKWRLGFATTAPAFRLR